MYDLWPPESYPVIAFSQPSVTGCTRDAWADGLTELSANNPAVAAVTTRLHRPVFVKGQGGLLRWSVTVTPLAGVDLDVQQQVLFFDDPAAQVGRWTGPQWHIEAGIVLSTRLVVPRTATTMELKVLSLCDTNAGDWTEQDILLEQVPSDPPYVPPARDEAFGDASSEGVAPPAPPAGLPGTDANSPARRSPQVRWCQVHDSIRPDLTPKRNAREV